MRKCLFIAILAALALAFADAAQAGGITQRTIRFRVLNATPNPLTVDGESTNGLGEWREQPTTVQPLRTGDFTDRGWDSSVSGWIEFRIGGTGNRVRVSAGNPLIGNKSATCSVTPSTSPFTCRSKPTGGGNDMNGLFVVEPREARTTTIDVRDAAARTAALDALCGIEGMEYASCGAREVLDVSYSLTPTEPLGKVAVNCGGPGFEFATGISTSATTGTSYSVGVNSETKITLPGKLKLVLRAYYKHTWTESTTDTKSYKLNVPPGHYGWMERAMTMQDVRADYVVTAGNQTYNLPSVTVSAPATGDAGGGLAVARTVKIPDSCTVCANRDAGGTLPMPTAPRVGKSYAIVLNGANQRALTFGTTPLQLETADGSALRQWEFSELPGFEGRFQIRNVAEPARCLTNDVDDARLTASPCAAESEQIWAVELDPDTSSFRLISAKDGREPEAEGKEPGSKVLMRSAPAGARARWQFEVTR